MAESSTVTYLSPDLAKQEAYAQAMRDAGFDFSAVVMGAVVKGMRDLGYKSMGTALDELIDNSIQAEARHIHVYTGEQAKPEFIAIIDDGHGMSPTMLQLSAVWGAGHHEDDRSGFGKYGYGLPSACVSIGKRFSVYSKLAGSAWQKVYVDLTEIEEGRFGRGQPVRVKDPIVENPPRQLEAYLKKHFSNGLESGSIVFIDKIDRLTWKTTRTIDRQLKQHFGLVFRNYLRTVSLHVQGTAVKAVDPLFLTPDAQFFDVDEERAVPLPPTRFEVKDPDSRKTVGEVRVRYASMPPGFGRVIEDKKKRKGGKANARFAILDENNGLIVLRAGRQIDVVRSKRDKELGIEFSVNNDDRYWGVEIDFDPTLDDEFSITTSKQQVMLSDRMWQLLKENGVFAAVTELRKRYDAATDELKAETQQAAEGHRPSELAMAEADKFLPKPAPSRAADGDRALRHEAERRAKEVGVEPEQTMPKVTEEAAPRFVVTSEQMPASAAFYEPLQFGGQTRVVLNRQHPFYTHVYNRTDDDGAGSAVREALNLLLLTLAEAELNSSGEKELWYRAERSAWSHRLMVGVERYDDIVGREERETEDPVSMTPADTGSTPAA